MKSNQNQVCSGVRQRVMWLFTVCSCVFSGVTPSSWGNNRLLAFLVKIAKLMLNRMKQWRLTSRCHDVSLAFWREAAKTPDVGQRAQSNSDSTPDLRSDFTSGFADGSGFMCSGLEAFAYKTCAATSGQRSWSQYLRALINYFWKILTVIFYFL